MLLLRCLLGVTVAWQGWVVSSGVPAWQTLPSVAVWLAPLSGAFLVAGWLTPASSVVAGVSLALMITASDSATASTLPLNGIATGCMVVVALVVILLGPGAYSIDARWFGRREIVFNGDSSLRS